jgi:hypothetical protein
MELLQTAKPFLEQALSRLPEKLFRWTPEFQSLAQRVRLDLEFPLWVVPQLFRQARKFPQQIQ